MNRSMKSFSDFPLFCHGKELSVGLRSVEQPNELADKLLTELSEVPDGPRLQGMEPLCGQTLQVAWKCQAEQFVGIGGKSHLGFVSSNMVDRAS